ncbi:MAG: metallophosphoesterase [Bacteroidaceae bacterium]|nr:metallophosphoesterase [Bacteroidaceae bacterium]
MDRRNFIKRLAGSGALIATSALPVWADDEELTVGTDLFARRGQYERLSLCYATVRIGAEKPFSVLHISDTHLTAAYDSEDAKKRQLHESRSVTFGGRQEEALRDTLDWARQHVDYVVHTGDLIDWQSRANFDLVNRYFGESAIGSVGNHEFSTDMWLSEPKEEHSEAYKDYTRALLQEVYPFDVRFQSQVVHGVNFITLDDVYGYVTEEQVALFRREVERGLPIVLCMHIPFYTPDIWRASMRLWRDKGPMTSGEVPEATGDYRVQQDDPVTRDFISYLKTEPLLRCILAGHEHISVEDQFSPYCREYLVAGNFLYHGREVMFL